jgi:hypothetical protein
VKCKIYSKKVKKIIRQITNYLKQHKDIKVCFINKTEILFEGHPVVQLVEALRYKPEGRGFDTRWGHWYFSST